MLRAMRRARLLWCVLVSALLAAACSTSPSGVSGSSGASGAKAPSYVATLQARLATYEKVPQFVPPDGPPFDASKLKGKTVFSIPLSDGIPFCVSLEQSQAKVAKMLGIKYISYANQGNPAQWVAGFNEAIARHVDAILLSCAPNPAGLQPQIAAARQAGIPVVASPAAESPQCLSNPSFRDKIYKQLPNCFTTNLATIKSSMAGVTANVNGPYPQEAALMADWAIAKTDGKLDALIINSSDIYTANSIVATIQSELRKWCASTCKAHVIDVPSTRWSTELQSSTHNALLSDSSINYVLPIYDSMNQFAVPAITAAGRTNLQTMSYNGTPFVLKDIQQGNIVAGDLGESLDWKGYIAMDQVMRAMLKMSPATDSESPLRLWTKANISQAGTPPTIYNGYGHSYVSGFKKLWGIQ